MSQSAIELKEDRHRPTWVRGFVERRLEFLCLGVAGASLLAFAGRWWWILDLFCHYRVYYAMFLLVGSITLLQWQRRKPAAIAMLMAIVNLVLVVPLQLRDPTAPASDTDVSTLRVMSLNVNTRNPHRESVANCIRKYQPDVLLMMEVNQSWLDDLHAVSLFADFEYQMEQPREDNFGIAIYSRHELTEQAVRSLSAHDLPTLVTTIHVDGHRFRFIGTHPVPPINGAMTRTRDIQLQAVAQLAAQSDIPCIVAGDLNTTSWSYCFGDLLKTSRLRDSRRGFGVQPTWFLFGGLLQIPIDHVLIPDQLTASGRFIGPDVGSDHRAVIVDLGILPHSR
ncbi:MAG: endonuclease/exonuclease/phosphatase family protein [Pirellulaceae bacterium]|nr:endonuclease/exonuclease/phosphatase family protein [Planctomycetales bacterium]